MDLLLVGAGGFAGENVRYLVAKWVTERYGCAAPADGIVYRERLDGDAAAMLAAIDATIAVLQDTARALGIAPRVVSLPWYARAQSLSQLVVLEDLEPARGGRGYGRLGEPPELQRVRSALAELSRALAGLRDACVVGAPGERSDAR